MLLPVFWGCKMSDDEGTGLDFIEDDLRPYYEALGRVVHSCSQLQMSLGYLFSAIMNGRAKSIFNVPHSDRVQIEILEAAINETVTRNLVDDDGIEYAHGQLVKLCTRSKTLLDDRNQLVHSPYTLSVDFEKYKIGFISAHRSGNRFALQLKDADVLQKMASYEQRATRLMDYASKAASYFGPFHRIEDLLTIPECPKG